jgi:hypothetical protein
MCNRLSCLRTSLAPLAVAVLVSAVLAGCGGGSKTAAPGTTTTSAAATTSSAASSAPSETPASTNPCSLLTDAEVAKLAPGVGHAKLDTVAGGARICDWPDASGIPAVQLQVYAAPSSSLRAELKNGIDAFGGYAVVDVAGLGDEAAAAFQKADASKGIAAGLAALSVRSGDRVLGLTTPRVQVQQGSQKFALVRRLAATALSRLEASR